MSATDAEELGMSASRWVASVALVLAPVLLACALFLPWYAYEVSSSAGTDTQLFYPGLSSENHTVRYVCGGGFPSCHADTSYVTQGYGSIGMIAEAGLFIVIASLAFAVVTALLAVKAKDRAGRLGLTNLLGAFACALTLASAVLYAVGLPGAEGRDVPSADRPPTSGPWTSFLGSTSWNEPHLGTLSLAWGPAAGWYLAVTASVLFALGLIFRRLSRPAPVSTPSVAPSTP